MKRGLSIISVFVAFAALLVAAQDASAESVSPATASQSAADAKARVLDWLTHLPNRAGHRVLTGAFGGYSAPSNPPSGAPNSAPPAPGTFGLDETTKIQKLTGRTPGLLACDYASRKAGTHEISTSCNAKLVKWWTAGGLVSVSVHAPNPNWSDTEHRDGALSKLANFGGLLNDVTLKAHWYADLDKIAAGLAELQAAGVPVLFRPLHEMNGNWFWWGAQDPATFINVWNAEYDYLTVNKGLKNLIWVYAPSASANQRTAYYPGSDRVDIVGLDAYVNDPSTVKGYEEMVALGKPFAFTEIGAPELDPPGTFDFRRWTTALRTQFPATIYALTWNQKWNPAWTLEGDQNRQHADEYFNDRLMVNGPVINLDDKTVAAGSPIQTGPRQLLTGFEGSLDGWTARQSANGNWSAATNGPWPVTEWSSEGGSSLKANVDLAAGLVYLSQATKIDLTGATALSVDVRTAPWGNHAAGTRARLLIKTGANYAWRDSGDTVVGPDGVILTLRLSGIAQLNDVREIGVDFRPAPGASGGSAVYLDNVTVHL